ncbi:serine protease [Variovorax robiniae]|uniref:Serine protease n=1 Tax=Variovorax robiniae TaxID=1836199 RepID=A0ABU8X896_9BURK
MVNLDAAACLWSDCPLKRKRSEINPHNFDDGERVMPMIRPAPKAARGSCRAVERVCASLRNRRESVKWLELPEQLVEIEQFSTFADLNPERGLRRGDPLRFDAKCFRFEGANGDYMPVASQQGILLALSFRDDDGHHTTGSGVLVGPGLAICAAHVLQDRGFYEKLTGTGATLVGQAPIPGGMLLWTVKHVTLVPDSDLAILSMSLTSNYPPERRFTVAHITTRMPQVGDELTLTGLSAVRETEEIASVIRMELTPGCLKTRVLQVYPEGAGSMIVGPCVAVDCEASGGMSGGPVFDSRGFLVGIVSAAIVGGNTSFVSHVWPALVRSQANPVWPADPYPRPAPATLLHLGNKFGVTIERPDAFALCVYNDEISLGYSAWS